MANPSILLPRVTGPCKVRVNLRTASTNVWTDLGYSVDGVVPRLQSFDREVHSDRLGGTDGPPVDIQKFGQIAKIELELVEYNLTALSVLNNLHNSTGDVTAGVITPVTAGKITNVGCLTTQKGASVQLLLIGQKDDAELTADAGALTLSPMNFPNCHLNEPIEIPLGSKNSVVRIGFTAIPFTAWDTANSGSGNTWLWIAGSTLISRLERYAS